MDNINHHLLFASRHGVTETIIKLLKHGTADINAKDDYGRTPLIYASTSGYTEIAKLLIHNNANPNITDHYGVSPLMLISKYGYTSTLKPLIDAGADINTKDIYGLTALILSSMRGHVDIVKMLIEAGADVNAKDNKGRTASNYEKYPGIITRAREKIDKENDERIDILDIAMTGDNIYTIKGNIGILVKSFL